MSEYQRYEFRTSDRPLTKAQLAEVSGLSSHIDASSTHAVVEYHWGNFKHDPLDVLYEYFDGFLYWANWGTPRLAFRFPNGVLPDTLLADFHITYSVTLTSRPNFDILDIHFDELEAPDEWTEYELSSLMPIREELIEGDMRSLYIVWLATQDWLEDENDDEDDDEYEDEDEDEGEDTGLGRSYKLDDNSDEPPTPPGLGTLTSAQQALAELLQLPEELLDAAAKHSAPLSQARPSAPEDLVALIEQLPPARRTEYLVRLAQNEPGLSSLFVRELQSLRPEAQQQAHSSGPRVSFTALYRESVTIQEQRDTEQRERARQAHERHLNELHDHPEDSWQRIAEGATRGGGSGYDTAASLLVELREVADHFGEREQFDSRYLAWVRSHLRRPALVKRLRDRAFPIPEN